MVLLGQVSEPQQHEKESAQREHTIDYVDTLVYGSSAAAHELPHYEMREESMTLDTAYQLVHDELEVSKPPRTMKRKLQLPED
jgi:hypothetical protein